MFTDFLYMLRAYGMDTSLNEWNLLLEALNSNLNECSLDEFYHMSRCILVKKVADYDRFDLLRGGVHVRSLQLGPGFCSLFQKYPEHGRAAAPGHEVAGEDHVKDAL